MRGVGQGISDPPLDHFLARVISCKLLFLPPLYPRVLSSSCCSPESFFGLLTGEGHADASGRAEALRLLG
jgi:hypothetical protein